MSLALLGGGITDMRGSVGGNTYSRSRFGVTVRAKTSPIQPRTSHQRFSRGQLSNATNRWSQVLTQVERDQWNAFAITQPQTNRFGQISYLSGQQWHNKLNVSATLLTASNYILTPPVTGTYSGPITLNLNASHAAGGSMSIGYTGTPGTGTPKAMIYATQHLTPGTAYVSSKLKYIGSQTAVDGAHSILALWQARFGNFPPIAGLKIFVLLKFGNNDDGTSSVPLITSAIVT
jgi:hypothetical protein